uniref:Uncharacterized protein n=1 Tax=Aegilops tauschii subsp. strangulata TaxID=200361 RepID=A0A453C811_AEGTS
MRVVDLLLRCAPFLNGVLLFWDTDTQGNAMTLVFGSLIYGT